jgi:hypothetical protein
VTAEESGSVYAETDQSSLLQIEESIVDTSQPLGPLDVHYRYSL